MQPPGHAARSRFALWAMAFGALLPAAHQVSAQEQERKLLDRIEHPNMDLHAEGFEKSFDTKGSSSSRSAAVHPFLFGGRTAETKNGDGMFHARSFDDGKGRFQTTGFAVKPSTAVDHLTVAQADRSFATSAVAVREDRAAEKSANTRDYVNSTKPFLVPGKRQDTMDELRRQKNLTIDQVREILNKSK